MSGSQSNPEVHTLREIHFAEPRSLLSHLFCPAGYYLAEFFLANPHLILGKRLLELGAGVGLTGLVASASASSVHMTDYTSDTIANMRHNIVLNEQWLKDKCPVTVGYLDWVSLAESSSSESAESASGDASSSSSSSSCFEESVALLKDADVLIGADCVYDVLSIPYFVTAVEKVLSLNEERQKVAYFATTYRNEKTFELFISAVQSKNICYREILFGSDETTEIFPCFAIRRNEIKLHEFHLLPL